MPQRIQTLAFSGLRPHKLPWGYNEDHKDCLSMKSFIRARLVGLIEDENVCYFISGMALGIDQICADIVLGLKEFYPKIQLEAAIPCKDQIRYWPRQCRERYSAILERCDSINLVCKEYSADSFERRNRYMIGKCDILLAVWNGRPGGTGNTISYAKAADKRIIIINPLEPSESDGFLTYEYDPVNQ